MSTYDWLLVLHVLGAFLLLGGAVAIGAIQLAALGRQRPSEIALLLNAARIPEGAINAGAVLVLVFGVWLTLYVDGYSLTQGWILGALALWVVSIALGGLGGARFRRARREAERLAGADDQPSGELDTLLHDRTALVLSWASGVAVLAILVLMIWKPGV